MGEKKNFEERMAKLFLIVEKLEPTNAINSVTLKQSKYQKITLEHI